MRIEQDLVEGIFIEEYKCRFLCNVLIENEIKECYVPSASKLKNYINMSGKKVLLIKEDKNASRTKYSLFGVRYYNKYILLNLQLVNKVLEEHLKRRYRKSDVKREQYINGYKSDFIISGDKQIIVEAKGVISSRKNVRFPTVFSKRSIEQLNKILDLLKSGYEVQYFIISLSPIVKIIEINKSVEFKEYSSLLIECIKYGMKLNGFSVLFEDNKVVIANQIKFIT